MVIILILKLIKVLQKSTNKRKQIRHKHGVPGLGAVLKEQRRCKNSFKTGTITRLVHDILKETNVTSENSMRVSKDAIRLLQIIIFNNIVELFQCGVHCTRARKCTTTNRNDMITAMRVISTSKHMIM